MTIPINQNSNRTQSQAGLSSLNAAYLKRLQANPSSFDSSYSAPAQVQTPAQNYQTAALNTTQAAVPYSNQTTQVNAFPAQNSITSPNKAYMPGVGAVPSGYLIPAEENHSSEDHIIKKTPFTGPRIMADKVTKGLLLYAPKGMQGSKNSNFYEYLSLGIIPNIVGCAMLIATSSAAERFFNPNDAKASAFNKKNAAMGVILYAAMKWAGNKFMNKGVHLLTGVDMEMPYKKVISELPENGKTRTTTEFHRVFESVDFPRWDLINKQGEEHNNRYEYYDKIAKEKLGCDEPLNAPDQVVQPLIKKALTKAMAAKSIAGFLWAATGVAIAAQKPCSEILDFPKRTGIVKNVLDVGKNIGGILVKSAKQLWNGSSRASGVAGKSLIILTAATTVLGLLNVKRGYKIDKEQSKTKIDYTKDYTEN